MGDSLMRRGGDTVTIPSEPNRNIRGGRFADCPITRSELI